MIKIICVGHLKDSFKVIAGEYVKRISSISKITIFEVNEYNSNNYNGSLLKESQRIKKHIKGDYFVLDEKGDQLRSEEFSELLKIKNLTFVIGSHLGLSQEIKTNAKGIIGLSMMTLPHQLARILLLEQIYRGFTILKNHPYHK